MVKLLIYKAPPTKKRKRSCPVSVAHRKTVGTSVALDALADKNLGEGLQKSLPLVDPFHSCG